MNINFLTNFEGNKFSHSIKWQYFVGLQVSCSSIVHGFVANSHPKPLERSTSAYESLSNIFEIFFQFFKICEPHNIKIQVTGLQSIQTLPIWFIVDRFIRGVYWVVKHWIAHLDDIAHLKLDLVDINMTRCHTESTLSSLFMFIMLSNTW